MLNNNKVNDFYNKITYHYHKNVINNQPSPVAQMALSANSSVEPPLFLKLSADHTLVKNKINCFTCQEAASRKK